MSNEIIEMKKVNDTYEADMNPYSEFVYKQETTQKQEFTAPIQNIGQQITREQALKNLNEFMTGVDTMMHVAEEFVKRWQHFKKI